MRTQVFHWFTTFNQTNWLKCRIKINALFIIGLFSFSSVAEDNYQLLLAGGALKTCSSFLSHNCKNDVVFSSAKSQDLYIISSESHARFRQALIGWKKDQTKITRLHSALEHIYSQQEEVELSKDDLWEALNAKGITNDDLSSLSDYVYFALLDTHEHRQTDDNNARLSEKVSISGTLNPHSRAIYSAFVEQARLRAEGVSPKVLVVTASARDPFSVADFYTGIFSELGADTSWLPVSAAFQLAQFRNECSNLAAIRTRFNVFDRERLYPQRTQQQQHLCESHDELLNLIEKAQGIFFNGGDQSKTLASLVLPDGTPSPLLKKIREQVEKGELIVGGTSAGTAVQGGGVRDSRPLPMLTSGDADNAMSRGIFYLEPPSQRCDGQLCENGLKPGDITLNPAGGTGLFSYGLIDTHFSERDRETRLIIATLLSGHALGFGVDETTALMVRSAPKTETVVFEVIGERGVFVVDLTEREWLEQKSENRFARQVGGHAHYWTNGTRAVLDNDGWQVTLDGEVPETTRPVKNDYAGKWRSEVAYKCGSDNVIDWSQFGNQYVVKADDRTRFAVNGKLCGYQQLPFVIRREETTSQQ